MESLIHKAKGFTGDSFNKIESLKRHLDGPDRKIIPAEELERYEAILDSYLERRVDKETGELVITTLMLSSKKNVAYVSDVISKARDLLFYSSLIEPRDIRDIYRIRDKTNFLEKSIDFYKNAPKSVSADNLASYANLLHVLEKQNKK